MDWLENQDFDWYKANVPFLETPDKEIDATYYYRWELVTRHICYGSPNSGYLLTEFANRPFWSGAYGAIACPSGHQFYEIRWMHNPHVARDYLRYWFRTKGAQPRKYSSWLADSAWAVHQVHPNEEFILDLFPDLLKRFGKKFFNFSAFLNHGPDVLRYFHTFFHSRAWWWQYWCLQIP